VAEAPIVDSHVHIFTQDMPLSPHAWTRPEYSFIAEDLLATLDAHGVHFAVVAGISLYGYYNDYMVAKLREHPRLRGTANVPPTIGPLELAAMKDAGVVGVRLFLASATSGDVPDIRDADHRLLLRRVRDLDLHVHLVAQDDVFADALETVQAAGVKLVIDHFGGADPALGADCPRLAAAMRAVEAGNAWIKISAGFRFTPLAPPRTADDYARAREAELRLVDLLLERVGPERLLWGSDCPFVGHEGAVTYADTIASFHAAVPDAGTRRAISDAALRLYFS